MSVDKKKEKILSVEMARELLEYKNGNLYWRVSRGGMMAGSKAGSKTVRKYIVINLNNRQYFIHRVIWLIVFGEWPNGFVDHIDQNRSNNKIENLRVVSHQENFRNQRLPSNNTSGAMGVYLHKSGKWVASIRNNWMPEYLGIYEKKEDAINARKAAEARLGFHRNHGKNTIRTEKKNDCI